jgi:hypothetical protein
MQKVSNLLYEAWNLSFNGTNNKVIDTGVYLFTQENINRDFEFIAEGIYGSGPNNEATIICAKHNRDAYGFLVRASGSSSINYNGTIFVRAKSASASVIIRRVGGVITLSGTDITNPNVKFTNAVFDWPLVLGCAIENDGSRYRFAMGTIQHIKVQWL